MKTDFTIFRLRCMLIRHYAGMTYERWISLPTQYELVLKLPFLKWALWFIYYRKQE